MLADILLVLPGEPEVPDNLEDRLSSLELSTESMESHRARLSNAGLRDLVNGVGSEVLLARTGTFNSGPADCWQEEVRVSSRLVRMVAKTAVNTRRAGQFSGWIGRGNPLNCGDQRPYEATRSLDGLLFKLE